MNVTTWGELTDEWIGRTVLVRWEDGTLPSVEGFPSGIPHEWHGRIETDVEGGFFLVHEPLSYTDGFPDHALVQEAPK